MAPNKKTNTTARSKKPTIKQSGDSVVKRKPARGFHRFRSGILNVTPKGAEKELVKRNQDSPLLQLPPELRQKIWEEVLGGKNFRCQIFDYKIGKTERMVPPKTERAFGLCLLRTCRQIYSETALLPYKLNIITFSHLSSFRHELMVLQKFQRSQVVGIHLEASRRSGILYPHQNFAKNAANYRKRNLALLPVLKRIHVLVFGPDPFPVSYVDDCIKNSRYQIDIMFATENMEITFEVMTISWLDYYGKW
ncbi:hypothetical protein CC86DRAFT_138684 [Ophiobolus disseminans]|uniref:Uncharacterized protein n=1 Tax=Ophiobolus disseminans TaxID=1469910 RepID=A0A6A7ADJ8_9PLEO|nr:hypothetical protein CC86DRAFT_138684 [Ophiobolus disseminans]